MESTLPNNYFSALVQHKSLERRLGKDPQLKGSYSKTIKEDFEKGILFESIIPNASELITVVNGTYHITP